MILETMQKDVITAMKAKQKDKVQDLRFIVASLSLAAKEGNTDEIGILSKELKRRDEASKAFRDGDRIELAEAEERQAELIKTYLPAPLSAQEIDDLIEAAVSKTGAESARDMGKVMAEIKSDIAGRADGKTVSGLVRQRLS